MKNEGSMDIYIGMLFGFFLFLYFIITDPFLLVLIIPFSLYLLIVLFSGTTLRDAYFKAKKNLLLTIAVSGFLVLAFYYFLDSDFTYFVFNQDSYVTFAVVLVFFSLFLNWFSKRSIPISFLGDDDRLVQETMYEDYSYKMLGDSYLYRTVSFRDSKRKLHAPDELHPKIEDWVPAELSVLDLEMEAIDGRDRMKFYYEKVVFDMFNDFCEGCKDSEKMLKMYGYNLTIVKGLKDIKRFEEALKKESLLCYKIFKFLEKDMNNPSIKIQMNWQNIYSDNYHCLELCLVSIILMVRQYINFPVGDLAKYVVTKKDKNFIGAFSSLPADFANINSTSVSPSGMGYYYTYYRIHYKWFAEDQSAVLARWVK
ncbi:MAG: hypothetical protein A3F91_09385 [Flavobacteria bacterium RIFCSPLOWO2_12_FULL_35_11]|nr:MAG: hypothetical protein A3F91_09385 [Flavobacteria bacterium RIFCSPLOWO2_12_FULL_35_11]